MLSFSNWNVDNSDNNTLKIFKESWNKGLKDFNSSFACLYLSGYDCYSKLIDFGQYLQGIHLPA